MTLSLERTDEWSAQLMRDLSLYNLTFHIELTQANSQTGVRVSYMGYYLSGHDKSTQDQ